MFGSDKLVAAQFFDEAVFRVFFCQPGELGVERSFAAGDLTLGSGGKFGKDYPHFVSGGIRRHRIADSDACRMRQFFGPLQLEFAVIAGKDTAPGHADVDGNDGNGTIVRQHLLHSVTETGHHAVAGDVALRKNTDNFTVAQHFPGFGKKLLQFFGFVGRHFQKTCRTAQGSQPGRAVETFMHHETYRAAGRAGDEEHIDKT